MARHPFIAIWQFVPYYRTQQTAAQARCREVQRANWAQMLKQRHCSSLRYSGQLF